MRKVIATIAIIGLICITATTVYAKSLKGEKLIANSYLVTIIKADTEGKMHTSVYPTSINSNAISVKTLVQRTDGAKLTTKGTKIDIVTEINKSYIYNLDLGTTQDTRAVWTNQTIGTTLVGDFYINNGYDY